MQSETLRRVSLADKYDLTRDRVYLTGIQALVRLCLMQSECDRRVGLDTGGYVSGYRGSPLGGLDLQFSAAGDLLTTLAADLFEELASVSQEALSDDLLLFRAQVGLETVSVIGVNQLQRNRAVMALEGPSRRKRVLEFGTIGFDGRLQPDG